MKDYIYFEDIEGLKDNISDDDCKIIYMKRKTADYYIHIICCQFSDSESLERNWKELINNVSEVVQKELQDLIEIYNVYVVFFQPQVKKSLIYKIEQDKYSSRKVVLTKELPDDKEKLEQIISSKLFELEIEIENNDKCCFIDGMESVDVLDENNYEIELKQYIEKRAWEEINEKNK